MKASDLLDLINEEIAENPNSPFSKQISDEHSEPIFDAERIGDVLYIRERKTGNIFEMTICDSHPDRIRQLGGNLIK